jgi:hypothetical protein
MFANFEKQIQDAFGISVLNIGTRKTSSGTIYVEKYWVARINTPIYGGKSAIIGVVKTKDWMKGVLLSSYAQYYYDRGIFSEPTPMSPINIADDSLIMNAIDSINFLSGANTKASDATSYNVLLHTHAVLLNILFETSLEPTLIKLEEAFVAFGQQLVEIYGDPNLKEFVELWKKQIQRG